MAIFIITISILVLTGLSWLIRQLTPIKICPVCAGVAGTWLWLLIGMFKGFLPADIYQLPAAILMGGSVVGIAYQLEKKLPPQKSAVIFKALFIPAGFIAAYFLILSQWLAFVLAILFLAVLTGLFIKTFGGKIKKNQKVAEIKKRMENCC